MLNETAALMITPGEAWVVPVAFAWAAASNCMSIPSIRPLAREELTCVETGSVPSESERVTWLMGSTLVVVVKVVYYRFLNAFG
ncbi:hypothetical protein HYY75_08610 [bacterium]|nr:hypothetical protein [bacterium]